MVVLVVKRRLAAVFAVCLGLGVLLAAGKWMSAVPAFSAAVTPPVVLVIDPGHGGEDGGTLSCTGVRESGLNLEIALRMRDLMAFLGQPTVMTRTEDRAIYSSQAQTLREKKASDLKNRVSMVNELDGAVLLSIHQNSLPSSPVTHGAQVFWNGGGLGNYGAGHAQPGSQCGK